MFALTAAALIASTFAAPTPDVSVTPSGLVSLCSDASATSCQIDNSKYLGTWYEQGTSSIIRETFEANNNCVRAHYTLNADGKSLIVDNAGVDARNNSLIDIIGTGKLNGAGQIQVSFGSQTNGGSAGAFFQGLLGSNYFVKNVWTPADDSSDYQIALVTYGKDLPAALQFTWVLSRVPEISDADLQTALDYALAAGFDAKNIGFQRTACTDEQRAVLDAAPVHESA